MTRELLNKDGSPMREHESPIVKQLLEESESGLNPMELKTATNYLEYILNSEREILWMHFDEAQRIESAAKDECFEEGFQAGFNSAITLVQISVSRIDQEFKDNQDNE
jgi:hypothetical protein